MQRVLDDGLGGPTAGDTLWPSVFLMAGAVATQTIALQSYQRSFVEFKFGQGAALSNILIVLSLVFAVIYLRSTRRQIDE